MTHVLIILFALHNKGGVTTQEFDTKATCEAAITEIEKYWSNGIYLKCVKK